MHRFSFKQLTVLPLFPLLFNTIILAQTSHRNPCQVFIGVETSPAYGGVKVDKTLYDSPAQIYGVQPGDRITAFDGVPVRTQSELTSERDKHQQGEAFTLTILREGVEKTINARFKSCSAEELEVSKQQMEDRRAEQFFRMADIQTHFQDQFKNFEMGDRTILGVYENKEVNENGLVISSVVPGKGAEAAGLQAGDIVIKVDGKTITGGVTLRGALDNHKPGDQVTVVYLRDGKTIQTEVALSADQYAFTHKVERDPCKVFIGVYTSGNALEGRGLRVSGVIDGTPAKESAVQPGDIILAFNGVSVNNHQELTRERDLKKPGEAFRLTVLREGVSMEIDAKFKSCDTPGNVPVQETVEALQEDSKSEQRENSMENTLTLELFEAYPSPTLGLVNINFEAEAVPTTVRILDITGKAVYLKELPQFGGSFNEQVNLSNNKAGNYVLSIQQGDKVRSKQIVLLPRA